MADIRITPGSGSIQFSGSVSEDVISLIYTGSAVQFNTGSTNLIHISSSGFVGIGTTGYLPYNTSSFVVNTNTLLAQGLVVGAPGFFNNGLIEFYGSDFSIAANNVIGLNSFNIGGVPAIGIQYSNGNVGIGTGTYPPSARLHVSGGEAYFTDDITVGYNAFGTGKVYFGPSPLLYVTGDTNINEIRVKSEFGSVVLEGNNNVVTVGGSGLSYSFFGNTPFTVSTTQLTYTPATPASFNVGYDGSITSTVILSGKFNLNYGLVGAGTIVKQFSIDPQNGFDIYTGSVQLLGIKETGNVQVGSLTNPNSVLEVTGSIQVSGSIYTNGTNIQTLSIAYAIALG